MLNVGGYGMWMVLWQGIGDADDDDEYHHFHMLTFLWSVANVGSQTERWMSSRQMEEDFWKKIILIQISKEYSKSS